MTSKRVALFLVLTFCLTWAYEFLVVWPMLTGSFGGLSPAMVQVCVAVAMFMPAVAVVITRFVTKEGFSNALIAPVHFRKTWKWWIIGWFGPALLVIVGALFYFIIYSDDFDSSLQAVVTMLSQTSPDGSAVAYADAVKIVIIQVITGVLLAPALNFFVCFGEEWGWRGYLLPKMLETHSILTTLFITGAIWGLWHAPLIMLGHNYGFEYWGFPYTGILMMCAFCIVMGTINSFLTLKTGSCMPAVFAHGSVNGLASVGILFSVTGGNPFIGPAPTGVVGGFGFIICALIMAYVLMNKQRSGEELLEKE